MNVLQIALALAVSMLIFSTLATMIVEMIHKVLKTRKIGLKQMLKAFYETEVKSLSLAPLTSGTGDDRWNSHGSFSASRRPCGPPRQEPT
ncbi:MAG: hypothetical protein PVG78_17980, partial [Desulfobacterales bacterium]